ncbi:hypothetical protein D3C87_1911680 [compost metagenome]
MRVADLFEHQDVFQQIGADQLFQVICFGLGRFIFQNLGIASIYKPCFQLLLRYEVIFFFRQFHLSYREKLEPDLSADKRFTGLVR